MISYAPSKRTRESNMHVRSCRDIHVGPERVAASQCLPPHTHIVRVQALMIQCNLVTLTETRNATNIWHIQTGDPTDVLHINIPGGVDTQKRTAGNVKRREKGEGRERRCVFFCAGESESGSCVYLYAPRTPNAEPVRRQEWVLLLQAASQHVP